MTPNLFPILPKKVLLYFQQQAYLYMQHLDVMFYVLYLDTEALQPLNSDRKSSDQMMYQPGMSTS